MQPGVAIYLITKKETRILFFYLLEPLAKNAADVTYRHECSVVDLFYDSEDLTGFLLSCDYSYYFTFCMSVPSFAVNGRHTTMCFFCNCISNLRIFLRKYHDLYTLLVTVKEQIESIAEYSGCDKSVYNGRQSGAERTGGRYQKGG